MEPLSSTTELTVKDIAFKMHDTVRIKQSDLDDDGQEIDQYWNPEYFGVITSVGTKDGKLVIQLKDEKGQISEHTIGRNLEKKKVTRMFLISEIDFREKIDAAIHKKIKELKELEEGLESMKQWQIDYTEEITLMSRLMKWFHSNR